MWDLNLQDITKSNLLAFASKIVFTIAATFVRLSLCCFYYRLVADSGIKWFQWVVHFNVLFNVAVGVAFVSMTVFLCT